MNAYEQEKLIKRAPQGLLMAVMQGQSDDFPQWMALAEINSRKKMGVANDGVKAQQQLAQGQQSVKDRRMAELLPEMQGIGQLPAPNMETLAAAGGGLMSYADGGEVESYGGGGRVPTWEDVLAAQQQWKDSETPWYMPTPASDPSAGAQARYKQVMAAYEGKKPLDFLAPLPKPEAAAAPAANPLADAPKSLKKDAASLAQPKVPVADPTKAEADTMDAEIGKLDKWTNYLDKRYGNLMDPIKAQLEKDRAEYANMKSENVGLALLGAAGALLKPGRTTASAIGEGLSTLGEYGAKFQPQLLAARQGISAGETGLAQAQAQMARGNFSTAAQLENQREQTKLEREKLEEMRGYHQGYIGALNARAGAGSGLADTRLQAQLIQNRIKQIGIPTSEAQRLELQDLQNRYRSLISGGGSSLSGELANMPKGGVLANG